MIKLTKEEKLVLKKLIEKELINLKEESGMLKELSVKIYKSPTNLSQIKG